MFLYFSENARYNVVQRRLNYRSIRFITAHVQGFGFVTYLPRRGIFAEILGANRRAYFIKCHRGRPNDGMYSKPIIYLAPHTSHPAWRGAILELSRRGRKKKRGPVRRVRKRRRARQSYPRYSSPRQLYTSETAASPGYRLPINCFAYAVRCGESVRPSRRRQIRTLSRGIGSKSSKSASVKDRRRS